MSTISTQPLPFIAQPLSSLVPGQRATVICRAREDAYENTVKFTKVTLKLVDATDSIEFVGFIGDGNDFGSKIRNIRQGTIVKVSGALVEANQPKNKSQYPFNPIRLRMDDNTDVEELKSFPGLPELIRSATTEQLTVLIRRVDHEDEKMVQFLVADPSQERRLTLSGPLLRQWRQRSQHDAQALSLHGINYGDNGEIKLTPFSTMKIVPAQEFDKTLAPNVNIKKRKRLESDSSSEEEVEVPPKKLKLESSLDDNNSFSNEMADIVRTAIAEISVDDIQTLHEACPIETCTNSSPEKPDLPMAHMEDTVADPEPVSAPAIETEDDTSTQLSCANTEAEVNSKLWELPKDHVLLITSTSHFNQMTQGTTLSRRGVSRSRLWTIFGTLACVIACSTLYFIVHDKLVIFLSLVNFLKFA